MVSGLIALFTTSVIYVSLVCFLVFIVLLLFLIVRIISWYDEATSG